MFKITTTVRAAVRQIVASSNSYDADTVRISRSGEVTALKDADKTYAGSDSARYLIAHVADIGHARRRYPRRLVGS